MDVLDQPLVKGTEDHILVTALRWWEGRRLWFNGAVLLSGIAGFLFRPDAFGTAAPILLEVTIWVLLGNVVYCAGYMLEAMLYQYGPSRFRLQNTRWVFFILGTGLVCFTAFSFVSLWYLPLY